MHRASVHKAIICAPPVFKLACVIVVIATLGTAPVPVFRVAARRPTAGSNSWTGQTHERGQQGRRQGHPRGGLSIAGKADNGLGGRFEAYTRCLLYVAREDAR